MQKKTIKRLLKLPNKSFLLFGPRGVGKSTIIQSTIKNAFVVNLLKSSQYVPLSQDPSLLREWVSHLKPNSWVIIDEVQKIPALMDEVHYLYEEKGLHFALSGSSARKLKRGGANLLAGRALQNYLFPFVYNEFKNTSYDIKTIIDWGCLPIVILDKENRIETLASYVETYLKQELIEEGLIRKLDPFARFLKIAGMYNAQVLNIENIARESHVNRTTVDTYFEILEDTLLGYKLPAIQFRLQTKEVIHPKFYFFDSGVARAASGLIYEDVDNVWRGFALETYLIHEIKSYNFYNKKMKDFFYYRVSGGTEIDLLIEIQKKTISKTAKYIAIEIKFSKKWDNRWSAELKKHLTINKKIQNCIGIYFGNEILTQGELTIYPVEIFLKKLWDGEIF